MVATILRTVATNGLNNAQPNTSALLYNACMWNYQNQRKDRFLTRTEIGSITTTFLVAIADYDSDVHMDYTC